MVGESIKFFLIEKGIKRDGNKEKVQIKGREDPTYK